MATYVPNATQTSEPVESQTVESAALEFRTLKTRVNSLETAVNLEDTRDLRVPEAAIAAVPAIASRAGKVLGFDAAGDPVVVEVSGATDPSLRADLAASSGAGLVGYQPPVVGSVARTLQSKLHDIVNIADFGASPTASADANSIAIQAAIDSLPPSDWYTGDLATGGGTVYIPAGVYSVSSTIYLPDSVNLIGAGSTATRLSWPYPSFTGACISVRPVGTHSNVNNISVSGMVIEHGGYGLYLLRLARSRFSDLVIRASTYGIFGDLVAGNTFDNIFIHSTTTCAIYIRGVSGGAQSTTQWFNSIYISNAATYGILLDGNSYGVQQCTFTNTIIEYSDTPIYIGGSFNRSNAFNGLWLEGNTDSVNVNSADLTTFTNVINGGIILGANSTNTTIRDTSNTSLSFSSGAGKRKLEGFNTGTITDSDVLNTSYSGVTTNANLIKVKETGIQFGYIELVYSSSTLLTAAWTYPISFTGRPTVTAQMSQVNTSNGMIYQVTGTMTTPALLSRNALSMAEFKIYGTGFVAGDKVGLFINAVGNMA
jgi:hypothetical protein